MKRVMIHHNYKPESLGAKKNLIRLLKQKHFIIVDHRPELIIVIGGDGTMLSAVRTHRELHVPFIGINTGSLGFLPTVGPTELEGLVNSLIKKDYQIQNYPLLKVTCATVNGNTVVNYAFNEILIKHLEPRLMEVKLFINNKPFNYFTGDGFIISTPIGATGYAIWAGGVATHSELPVYQVTPLNPNDNSINRPLKTSMVVPMDTVFDFKVVKAKSREVIVACDGAKVSNDYISELNVCVADDSIKILRLSEFDYYEFYRSKIIDKNISRSLDD
ncbi:MULTISPECIES: NAD(+)/NADH kinase [unclassified Fusibacter]|uniref:NAD(+)/NADH kinase n=1 Tax=unclassified Fusibacter TaxID=2624464 RepID=UPI0010138B32|nr:MULTISPECIES: NAD(+)/NADH kinase [unclassified Fusibacter]MCK8059073.1 NAD(+)/NADH kinase [Fusibacter sp. A2]NPE22482.1 NAD(+)/NADH kinase [Fusibacter sp. A1]RXV60586.1 NAD(+)/NADH kinase [Fusibacter sp. A1]